MLYFAKMNLTKDQFYFGFQFINLNEPKTKPVIKDAIAPFPLYVYSLPKMPNKNIAAIGGREIYA